MSRIFFVHVMPARLSYYFRPSKGRMEKTYFERKGTLDYRELESNPKSGRVPSSRVIITYYVVANGAL